MNASLKLRISFVAALTVIVLGAFGCGAGGGGAETNGGGSTGGGPAGTPQLTITTTTPLPRATTGQPYDFTLQASGGTAPYTWSIPLGTGILPDGLSLNSNGVISGTPAASGACEDLTPMFQVQDAKGLTASERLELLCVMPLAFSSGSSLATGNVGLMYSSGVNAVGGVQPYTFTLISASALLPMGLTFSSQPTAAIIQGTPTSPGNIAVTIQVVDSGTPQLRATQSFNLIIGNDLVVEPSGTMPIGVQNVAYSEVVQVFGGTPPYHWSAANQSQLPSGLTLDSTTGLVHGIPIQTGGSGFLVQVVDSSMPTPVTKSQPLQFQINPPPKLDTLSAHDGTIGLGYGVNFNLEGGRPPYSATVLTGALPDGVAILPSSPFTNFNNYFIAMNGTPTKDGLFQFKMQFSDSYEIPNTIVQDFQIRISNPLAIVPPNPPPVIEGQSYSGTFLGSGGFPPYFWSATSVPANLTFDATTGTVSGIASSPGRGVISSFESLFVTLQDSSSPPANVSAWWGLEVFAKLRIDTSFFPAIATGSNVWLTPVYSGGVPPLTWSISSGSLPPGTTLNKQDGTISGTPSVAGSYPVTLSLSDSNQPSLAQVASRSFTLTVKNRAQMTRNDTILQATPVSNSYIVASISPFSGPGANGPDVDVYQLTAAPGALVDLLVDSRVTVVQPSSEDSLIPVLEVLDANGNRFQTCSVALNGGTFDVGPFTFPCINGLDGNFYSSANYTFQVPNTGTTPVTFYVRILDARGDARPDFLYTLIVVGAN
jgi:Putative Ig domain